jgi:hypothetical protein
MSTALGVFTVVALVVAYTLALVTMHPKGSGLRDSPHRCNHPGSRSTVWILVGLIVWLRP